MPYGRIICPLTGGRDSRVLAALLVHAGIPATYGTDGDPEAPTRRSRGGRRRRRTRA